jgi:hypothetical protein
MSRETCAGLNKLGLSVIAAAFGVWIEVELMESGAVWHA